MKKNTFITLIATFALLLMSHTASGQGVKISSTDNPFPSLSAQEATLHKATNPRTASPLKSHSVKTSLSGATILGWHTYPEPTF